MSIFQWKSKDWLDQPLHFIAGYAIAIVPLLFILFTSIRSVSQIATLLTMSFLLSVLACVVREADQHLRWTFNLDSFVWCIGAICGSATAVAIIYAVLI